MTFKGSNLPISNQRANIFSIQNKGGLKVRNNHFDSSFSRKSVVTYGKTLEIDEITDMDDTVSLKKVH